MENKLMRACTPASNTTSANRALIFIKAQQDKHSAALLSTARLKFGLHLIFFHTLLEV